MKTLSIIQQTADTKEQMSRFTAEMKEELLSGNYDILKEISIVKTLAESLDALLKDKEVKSAILTKAQTYGEKTFKHGNAEFQICEAGVKYDYSACQDTEWNELTEDIERLTAKRKEREKALQARLSIKEGLASMDTGEILLPPTKTSETIVKIKLC